MKLGQFPIPLHKLREGAQLCLENAQRLYNSARSLATHNEYATPLSLLILSSEEVAKGHWIIEKLKKGEAIPEDKWKKWTRGSAHIRKLQYLRDKLRQAYQIDAFKPFNEEELKALKEYGLYIDWKRNRDWSAFYEKLPRHVLVSLYETFLDIAEKSIRLLEGVARPDENDMTRSLPLCARDIGQVFVAGQKQTVEKDGKKRAQRKQGAPTTPFFLSLLRLTYSSSIGAMTCLRTFSRLPTFLLLRCGKVRRRAQSFW